jgi:hypothetical protein
MPLGTVQLVIYEKVTLSSAGHTHNQRWMVAFEIDDIRLEELARVDVREGYWGLLTSQS